MFDRSKYSNQRIAQVAEMAEVDAVMVYPWASDEEVEAEAARRARTITVGGKQLTDETELLIAQSHIAENAKRFRGR